MYALLGARRNRHVRENVKGRPIYLLTDTEKKYLKKVFEHQRSFETNIVFLNLAL